jgi:hypothetical protein
MSIHHTPRPSLLQRILGRLREQYKRWNDAQWPILVFIIGTFIYVLLGLPFANIVLIGTLILVAIRTWSYLHKNYIDLRIRSTFRNVKSWSVYHRVYPLYKWVDIFHAAQSFAAEHAQSIEIIASSNATLQQLLAGQGLTLPDRRCKPATLIPRKNSYTTEIFIPHDAFWLICSDKYHQYGDCIIRVHFIGYGQGIILEIAVKESSDGIPLLNLILDRAIQQSIYRCQIISPIFQQEIKPDYGDMELGPSFDIIFQPPPGVNDSNIVLDDTVRDVIEWSVIDFHNRRTELMRAGLPGRRGILFYGPPGTGKTYTCKYIAHRLADATTIVATGQNLGQIKTICHLAKQFQPALVILEDIDLIFADRTTNPYAPILGEFLEQLDGFRADDQVIFLLTTNAIERVESAIKDRPGRVSQCIYLGAPNATLRHRYLTALLEPYTTAQIDIDQLVSRTEGVSQAFLKELIFRAVQFATTGNSCDPNRIVLQDAHVTNALAQMIAGNDRWGKRIIGFHVGS